MRDDFQWLPDDRRYEWVPAHRPVPLSGHGGFVPGALVMLPVRPERVGEFSSFFSDWTDSRYMDGGERLVGIVGDGPPALATTVSDAGAQSCEGDVETVLAADPDVVVAVGEASVLAVARTAPGADVLPVDAGRGFRSVPADSVENGVRSLLDGDATVQSYPVLRAEHDGERVARAVADVTLVTAEVAHISEYSVTSDGSHVSQFRADGVVVTTPAGSSGYARRVDCPVIAPGTGVGGVAPIAPFATDPDRWILPLDDVRLAVERDETSVTLLADDRDVRTVEPDELVRITRDGTVEMVVVPESLPRYP